MNGTIHGSQLKALNYTKASETFTNKHETHISNWKEGISITRLRMLGHTKLTHGHKIKRNYTSHLQPLQQPPINSHPHSARSPKTETRH